MTLSPQKDVPATDVHVEGAQLPALGGYRFGDKGSRNPGLPVSSCGPSCTEKLRLSHPHLSIGRHEGIADTRICVKIDIAEATDVRNVVTSSFR